MSRLYELEKWPEKGHEEWIWPCDCGYCGHYLRARWDDDPDWRMIEIEYAWQPMVWRDRFRAVWLAIRGRTFGHNGIILNDKAIEDLKVFVNSR